MVELQPDVVTCDLIMPNLDGVGFVTEQMARKPLPIVIVSVASEAGELALNALDAGAVDFVQKPTALASERLLEMSDELIGRSRPPPRHACVPRRPRRSTARMPLATPIAARGVFDVVVLGISTGGPQALRAILPQLPAALPVPMAIVLHMPVGFTELYARKLDEMSSLKVCEAADGMEMQPGGVLLAPAGRHLSLRRNDRGVVVDASRSPAARYAAPAIRGRAVSVSRGRVSWPGARHRDDRHGRRTGAKGAAWIKATRRHDRDRSRKRRASSMECRARSSRPA